MLNLFSQINDIPFEPEHWFAATYYTDEREQKRDRPKTIKVVVKGAPERVLKMCRLQTDR